MAKFNFKAIADKFNGLPLWGKVATVAGVGLAGYMFIGKKDTTATTSENEALAVYPYADSYDFASADSAIDNMGSTGSVYRDGFIPVDEFSEWNSAVMESIAQASASNKLANDTIMAGANNIVDFNTGFSVLSGKEGTNTYSTKVYADGSKEIRKNGQLVAEESYKYIPSAYGGTRDDSKTFINPNKQLQQAQAAYAAATTTAAKQAAAKAGKAARAAGATEAGAQAVWQKQSTKSSKTTTVPVSSNADKLLQKAQAAYGAAKTKAEKEAAAKAGQAARAQGATEVGAQKIWQSLK